jgi:hypothetical protein
MPRCLHPLLLPLLLLAFVQGCGFDNADIGTDPPPLIFRTEGTVPQDSTENYFDPEGLNIVVRFNREIGAGEVNHVELVPRPLGMPMIQNPGSNAREIVIESVILDPAYSAYRLILDGPSMPAPKVLSYYSASQNVKEGAMHGHVKISRGRTTPENVLVYALVPAGRESEFALTGSEDTILGRPILGATNTILVRTEEGGWFRLAGLTNWRSYVVLAILDTSGDGAYDLDTDWWGYYRDELDIPLEVVAGVSLGGLFTPPLPDLRNDVDFWLLAPGSLDPKFE